MYIEWWMFLAVAIIIALVVIGTKPQPRSQYVNFYEELTKSPMCYLKKEKNGKSYIYQLFTGSINEFCAYSMVARKIISKDRRNDHHLRAYQSLVEKMNFTKCGNKDRKFRYYHKDLDMYVVLDYEEKSITQIFFDDYSRDKIYDISNTMKEWNRWGNEELEEIFG